MNTRTVVILGTLLSAILPSINGLATTNLTQRLSVSLVGYAESNYKMATNSTGTVNHFRQNVVRFRITTYDIIKEIGEVTGQSFSRRATMYLDGDGRIVIVDNRSEMIIPTEQASVKIDWDAVASQIQAQSIDNQNVQRLNVGTREYSTCTFTIQVGARSYTLKGFSIGTTRLFDDYVSGYSYELWVENARVMGEADLGLGDNERPLTGNVSMYFRKVEAP
jgi:hypothetical protein